MTPTPTDPALIARVEAFAIWLDEPAAGSLYAESDDLRALLRRIRELEAERVALRETLQEMLEHSGVTDVWDEDKFPEDIAAESKARRALASAPAEGGG